MPLLQTCVARPEWVASQNPAAWLTEREMALFQSWRSEKRRGEWLAGRLAAKRLIAEAFDLAPLSFVIGSEGPAPAVINSEAPPLCLSLSHSHGLGAATFSDPDAAGAAGVDVQRVRPVHSGLCGRVFTNDERRQIARRFGAEDSPEGMLLLWALKEAAIKARRTAWERPLREIEVELAEEGRAVVQMTGEPPMPAASAWLPGGWWLARAIRPPR